MTKIISTNLNYNAKITASINVNYNVKIITNVNVKYNAKIININLGINDCPNGTINAKNHRQ